MRKDKDTTSKKTNVNEDEVNISKFTFRDLAYVFNKYNQDTPVFFVDDENENQVLNKISRIEKGNEGIAVSLEYDNKSFLADSDEESQTKDKKIDESEDAFGRVGDVMTYYCRDFIFEDAPDDPDLKVAELFVSGSQFLRDRLPISINTEDIEDLRKNAKTGNYDTYRFMIYYVDSASDSKWYDAIDNIDDEYDYKDYIDRDSKIWRFDQEDFDDVIGPFLKEFPTYQAWRDHISEVCSAHLKQILKDSGKLPYEDAINKVKVNEDGIAYVIIGWRA